MIIKIRAQACERATGKMIGAERVEVIDTQRNRLFANVRTVKEAVKRFEEFWNELNPNSFETVKVLDAE